MYIRKSEHMLYFRWKKSEQQFFLFLANFDHFGENESNFEEFSEFSLFSTVFTLLLQNFFSTFTKFWLFFSSFTKNGQNQQKILSQPYDFFIFESRNIHSRVESV